jgi:phosphoglycerol transferase MdoB-like AlkP superfamily enzyme
MVEFIFRIISGLSIFELSTIRIIFGNVILSSIIAFICSLMKYSVGKWIEFVFASVIAIYAWLQLGFMNFIGVFISLQNASQAEAVKDYILDFFGSFHKIYYLEFIPIILLLVYLIFFSKRFDNLKPIKIKRLVLNSLLLIMLSTNIYYISITDDFFENKYTALSNKTLFMTVSNQSSAIASFGTSTFALLDIRTTFFSNIIDEPDDFKFINDKKNNPTNRAINDTAWNELINNTTNEDYNKLNNYYINQPITGTNDYTGMFEGKNVIFILMESVNDIFYEYPEYYPNFAKIANGGWNYVNNYSPRNACATLNNEFSGMTSLYSIQSLCTAKKYRYNNYPEGVFEVFNSNNYQTFSAHDYTEAYYPRSTIHTAMGSGEYFGVQKLGIPYSNEYINWANDDDFMKEMLNIIDNKRNSSNKPFMTWLTTVSSHQPYSVDSIQGNQYYSMTDGTNFPSDVRRFMSKLKILDNGLGILIDGLEERGILDDTLIVLYGDHYPYGISKDHLNKALPYDTDEDMNAEQVPLVIYNPNMEPKTIYDYTYYLNILPTVANLVNLDYDPRLYLGTDMNSEDFDSMVVFSDGSWKNEYAYYKASSNKVYHYQNHYTDSDVARINNIIETKMKISELSITTNYFKYLGTNLTKIKDKLKEQNICLNSEKDDYINGTHKALIEVEEAEVEVSDGNNLEDDEIR